MKRYTKALARTLCLSLAMLGIWAAFQSPLPEIATPNIDGLSKERIKLMNFYNAPAAAPPALR